MKKYDENRLDLVINLALNEKNRNPLDRPGFYYLDVAWLHFLNNNKQHAYTSLELAKSAYLNEREESLRQFIALAGDDKGKKKYTKEVVASFHEEMMAAEVLLGNKFAFENHFHEYYKLTNIQSAGLYYPNFHLAYHADEHNIHKIKAIRYKKSWENTIGTFKRLIVAILENDLEQFKELALIDCENFVNHYNHPMCGDSIPFNNNLCLLLSLLKLKGITLEIPHHAVPVLFGGKGKVETFPRIIESSHQNNEIIISDDVKFCKFKFCHVLVRKYKGKDDLYSAWLDLNLLTFDAFDIYIETVNQSNMIGIRIRQAGLYRFILQGEKDRSEQANIIIEIIAGRDGGIMQHQRFNFIGSQKNSSLECAPIFSADIEKQISAWTLCN